MLTRSAELLAAEVEAHLTQALARGWTRLALLGPRTPSWYWLHRPRWDPASVLRVPSPGLALSVFLSRLDSLMGIKHLALVALEIGAPGAAAIAARLPKLTSLDLGLNKVSDEGARAIAAGLPQLTRLDLRGNGLGDQGAEAIAAGLDQLTSLDLSVNHVGPAGIWEVTASLSQLTSLDLSINGLDRCYKYAVGNEVVASQKRCKS